MLHLLILRSFHAELSPRLAQGAFRRLLKELQAASISQEKLLQGQLTGSQLVGDASKKPGLQILCAVLTVFCDLLNAGQLSYEQLLHASFGVRAGQLLAAPVTACLGLTGPQAGRVWGSWTAEGKLPLGSLVTASRELWRDDGCWHALCEANAHHGSGWIMVTCCWIWLTASAVLRLPDPSAVRRTASG